MTWHLISAVRAAFVKLHCPYCGQAQHRGREGDAGVYRCRKCGKSFHRREGEKPKRSSR